MAKRAPKQKSERDPDDFYPTPEWCVRAGLSLVSKSDSILDPCAGDGAIVACAADLGFAVAYGVELHEGRVALAQARGLNVVQGDGFRILENDPVSTIVMNPPFSNGEAWVEAAVTPGRKVVLLMKTAFLGSQRRGRLFEKIGLPDMYVMGRRPSFMPDGKSSEPNSTYAWFVWPNGFEPSRKTAMHARI